MAPEQFLDVNSEGSGGIDEAEVVVQGSRRGIRCVNAQNDIALAFASKRLCNGLHQSACEASAPRGWSNVKAEHESVVVARSRRVDASNRLSGVFREKRKLIGQK
jgi:hypothetical protein